MLLLLGPPQPLTSGEEAAGLLLRMLLRGPAEKHYIWRHDHTGRALSLDEFVEALPADVRGLKDDPYRSLAALVRLQGGYDKARPAVLACFEMRSTC